MTKYILGGSLIVGVVLSFHETYWPWAIIPIAIVWGSAGLALALERRQ